MSKEKGDSEKVMYSEYCIDSKISNSGGYWFIPCRNRGGINPKESGICWILIGDLDLKNYISAQEGLLLIKEFFMSPLIL